MGRPQKQTVEYFPHFANNGKTIFILESKFGNDGYAFWFKLLEILATTEGHCFRVENNIDWEFLLAKTKVSSETAIEILNTLANLEAIDHELWSNKIIWVQKFVDNLSEVYRKRKVSAPTKPNTDSFRDENPTNEGVNGDINPQSKVKESKVKESKVESISEEKYLHEKAIELCKYYEELKPMQSITKDIPTLIIFLEDYEFDWCKEALQKTVIGTGKFVPNYMLKILKEWAAEGKPKEKGVRKDEPTKRSDEGNNLREQGIGL